MLLALLAAGCASQEELAPPVTTTAAYVNVRPSRAPAKLREFWVRTPGAFPSAVAAAPDGTFWFTELAANKIGRLDPSTGVEHEYELPTPSSGPRGITVAEDGSVWFTENAKAAIGRFDLESGEFQEYPLTYPRAKDPVTPIFAPNGTLWFTVERSNLVGKFEPSSRRFTFRELPRPGALPYDIAMGKDGAPWVCERGANRITRIDPETMDMHVYVLRAGTRASGIAVAPDGMIFYTDFEGGQLGRLDPSTDVRREWTAPAGRTSRPYAIAIAHDGTVWFSESGPRPSRLVRFDPSREVFSPMEIPGGGTIRNIAIAQDGQLYMASSDTDRLIVATPAAGPVAAR